MSSACHRSPAELSFANIVLRRDLELEDEQGQGNGDDAVGQGEQSVDTGNARVVRVSGSATGQSMADAPCPNGECRPDAHRSGSPRQPRGRATMIVLRGRDMVRSLRMLS